MRVKDDTFKINLEAHSGKSSVPPDSKAAPNEKIFFHHQVIKVGAVLLPTEFRVSLPLR
ncbi:MAG: hypothetical protein F6K31_17115 [Symploca sp. SIO2G7]|nr:hypothetical protein [Symploca sp. SIO2G7]